MGLTKIVFAKAQSYVTFKQGGKWKLLFAVSAVQAKNHDKVAIQVWERSCLKGLSKDQTLALRGRTLKQAK